MTVYLCYECYYNFCDEFRTVVKVVDDEVKALIWKEEVASTETDYRNYEEFTVE